jgi:hypothetical protein
MLKGDEPTMLEFAMVVALGFHDALQANIG